MNKAEKAGRIAEVHRARGCDGRAGQAIDGGVEVTGAGDGARRRDRQATGIGIGAGGQVQGSRLKRKRSIVKYEGCL